MSDTFFSLPQEIKLDIHNKTSSNYQTLFLWSCPKLITPQEKYDSPDPITNHNYHNRIQGKQTARASQLTLSPKTFWTAWNRNPPTRCLVSISRLSGEGSRWKHISSYAPSCVQRIFTLGGFSTAAPTLFALFAQQLLDRYFVFRGLNFQDLFS